MPDWSPTRYLRFEDERTRAASDLLAQVPLERPVRIVDVGCGPGNSTELLVERYPDAEVLGIDNSPAMLEEARRRLPAVRFEAADAETWKPDADVALVFANATYQWVPRHLEQLPRVLAALRPGAVLAVQMPDNLAEPTHQLMIDVAAGGAWAERLKGAARDRLPSPTVYYDALKLHAAEVDIWRTTYNHVLADPAAIVDFVRATGLRPFLAPLSEAEQTAFLADYTSRIAEAYPATADGKRLLSFPRLFIVARR